MLRIETITNIEDFGRIREMWNEFIRHHFPWAYFFDHDWLVKWIRAYLQEPRIFVFLVYDGQTLIGAVPLYIGKENFSGFPISRLALLGMGYGVEDLPIAGRHQEVLDLLFATINKTFRWHLANFSRFTPEFANSIAGIAHNRNIHIEERDIVNPVVRIEGTYADYFSGRSKNFRANVRKKTNRINSWGKMTVVHNDTSDLAALIGKVEAIGKESWQGEKGVNLAASEQGRRFLHDMVVNFHARGILDISFIELNGIPIAYLLGAVLDKTCFAIETAYLTKYFDASPGMLLHLYVLERLFDEKKVNLIDFGYDAAYKRKWTDDNRPEKQLILYNNALYPKLIRAVRNSSLYEKLQNLKKDR